MNSDFLTTTQAAEFFHVTRFTVRNWVIEGKLKAIATPGGHQRIPRDAVMDLLQRKQSTRHPPTRIATKLHADVPKTDEINQVIPNTEVISLIKKGFCSAGKQVGAIQKKFSKVLTPNNLS